MRQSDHSDKYQQLRTAFPRFVYESFSVNKTVEGMSLHFVFRVNEELVFKPTMFFPDHGRFSVLPNELMQTLAFHIGMVELISYWKAFCSPRILVKPFRLTPKQEHCGGKNFSSSDWVNSFLPTA
jgi:UDP-N-acetyl-alpha-D-muramoyl-L-alanyl-L-glutamate epimerase